MFGSIVFGFTSFVVVVVVVIEMIFPLLNDSTGVTFTYMLRLYINKQHMITIGRHGNI